MQKSFLYIFIIAFIAFIAFVTSSRNRILVIHSYHPEYQWTKEINDQINRLLPSSDIDLSYHYMDTKRNPDKEFKEKAGEEARRVISEWNPDFIIPVDDNAQEYVAKYYVGRARPIIIFTGVNASAERYGYVGAKNATGILERTPVNSIIEVMQHCFPNAKKFIHLSDSSITSELIHNEYHHKDWSPLVCTKALMIDTFEEWKKEVLAAEGKADFFLYTHYHTIKRSKESNEIVPPKEVIQWSIKNTKIPGIGNWGFFVKDGGMMSIAVSAQEQADIPCDYIKKYLKGTPLSSLPVMTTKKYSVYLNRHRIRQAGVKLPMVYTLLAEISGHVVEK
ncbi:sugar ABC transporter ATPase [Candidatus Magnetomorum sp. HK-1]|nr:sugar ABC transporter ATPase [Candidatus Magnetomorum sp. HK-1]